MLERGTEPSVNPSMIIVVLVPHERWLDEACPNCHRPFRPFDQVFESVDQKVAIHVHCVVALALVASAQGPKPASKEAVAIEYRRQRLAILNDDAVDDDVA